MEFRTPCPIPGSTPYRPIENGPFFPTQHLLHYDTETDTLWKNACSDCDIQHTPIYTPNRYCLSHSHCLPLHRIQGKSHAENTLSCKEQPHGGSAQNLYDTWSQSRQGSRSTDPDGTTTGRLHRQATISPNNLTIKTQRKENTLWQLSTKSIRATARTHSTANSMHAPYTKEQWPPTTSPTSCRTTVPWSARTSWRW